MMTWTQWPALITWLTLILLIWLAYEVGRARARYGVRVPATSGNEHFERVYRAHMNTLENVVVFLPALWLAAWYWKPAWACACGVVWLIGRIWYAVGYKRDAQARSRGFTLSAVALSVLVVGAAIGWVRMLG
jgi:glutathione S-transferase